MMEKWEEDAYWLHERMPDATEEQIEDFCERVAILASNNYEELDARILALGMIKNLV